MDNGASKGLAKLLGFKEEGVSRYDEVVREGQRGDHGVCHPNSSHEQRKDILLIDHSVYRW